MNVVAQNAGAGSAFLPRSELDEFLFAPVIDDANGMTVSVLSMLARAGVDPHSRAAELSRLTAAQATAALTHFIGESFHGLVSLDYTETIATRLAALLPRRTNPVSAPKVGGIGDTELTTAYSVGLAAILICILLVGAIWATAGRQSLAAAGGSNQPAPVAVVVAPTPTPPAAK